jgi:hypothetical protein
MRGDLVDDSEVVIGTSGTKPDNVESASRGWIEMVDGAE